MERAAARSATGYVTTTRTPRTTLTEPVSGIRNFIVGLIMEISADEIALRKEKTYINKLNLVLVAVSLIAIESAGLVV